MFTSSDFCDLDSLQVSGGFQPQNSIDGHVTEEVLVGGQDFGAQSCPEMENSCIKDQFKLSKFYRGFNLQRLMIFLLHIIWKTFKIEFIQRYTKLNNCHPIFSHHYFH